jgi:hypothetical protein
MEVALALYVLIRATNAAIDAGRTLQESEFELRSASTMRPRGAG